MAEKKHNLCYQTIHLATGRQYLGIHSTDRDDLDPKYLGSGSDLKRDVRKFGRGAFVRHVIRDFPTFEQAEKWERFQVREREVEDPRFYNMQTGGGVRARPGKAAKAKMRAAKIGKKQSPEHVEKRAAALRGVPRPAHCIEALQRANLNREVSAAARARMSRSAKRPIALGDEVFDGVSDAAKAKCVSVSTVYRWLTEGTHGARRLASGNAGCMSEGGRQRVSEKASVPCEFDGNVFPSFKAAGDFLGVPAYTAKRWARKETNGGKVLDKSDPRLHKGANHDGGTDA